MLPLLIFLIVSPLILLLFFKTQHNNEPPLRPPPGPKGLPIIGNLHQYDSSAPHVSLANLAKLYGPILSLRFGRVPVVVVQSAKVAKEVLQTQDLNFCSRPPLLGMQRLSYNGLDISFAPYGEHFREFKKLSFVHLLSLKRVQSFAHTRQEEVSRLVSKISSLSSAENAVNLSQLLVGFASSHICRIAFGKRYEDDEVSESRFHQILHETEALCVSFFFTDYLPYIGGWLDKLTGQLSRLERVYKKLDMFYEEIISDHVHPNRPKSDQEDIIDVLLQLRSQRALGFDLTVNHIKALLMNIFVAGTDTGIAMIIWAMTELMKNPNAMKKVQQELRNAVKAKGFVAEDDIPKLEYFKAMVKETFRLHPATPFLVVRETIRKTKVDGYDILPGTLVHVNVWAIGRDPEIWKDPERFMPERFIGSSIDFRGQDFELIPFGAGRRMCPGIALGVANLELTLANLLYSFDWEMPLGLNREDLDSDVLPGITMHKKNPLCLVAKKFS